MPFEEEDRIFLRGRLDFAVDNIHQAFVLKQNLSKQVELDHPDDFAFGWATGFAERAYYLYHTGKYGKMPTDYEDKLIIKEFEKRLGDFRSASRV